MAKVSSLHQDLWHWFANYVISPVRHSLLTDLVIDGMRQIKKLGNRCLRMSKRHGLWVWAIASGAALLLMVWNGLLLMALSIGLGVTVLIQRFYPQQPLSWQTVSKWFSGLYSPTIVAVGFGVLSMVASYMTLRIWQETDSFWLAMAILLQGLGLVSVLGLGSWHILQQQDRSRIDPTQIEYWINNLTALDPLKRLVAIRQISHYVESTPLDSSRIQELREYFQLLNQQESEPTIQDAIAQGIQTLNAFQ